MEHYNNLTPGELERLAILAEECSEVILAANKIIRHGFNSSNPECDIARNNRMDLEKECGHVLAAIDKLIHAKDIREDSVNLEKLCKQITGSKYTHHQ